MTDRERHLEVMKRQTDPTAHATTIYGLALDEMNDHEIRIAAYWLASRVDKLWKTVNDPRPHH